MGGTVTCNLKFELMQLFIHGTKVLLFTALIKSAFVLHRLEICALSVLLQVSSLAQNFCDDPNGLLLMM